MRGLARDLRESGDVAGFLCGANSEDRGFPSVALGSKVLVLGGLGRDAARKRDVLEHGIILGHSYVDLDVAGLLLGLLLLCSHLLLVSAEVLVVDVGSILRVSLGRLDGASSILVNGVCESVGLLERILDLLLDDLLDDRLHDLKKKWLGDTEEKLVVGLLDLDVEVVNLDINIVNNNKVGAILLLGIASIELEAESFTSKDDIHDTLIGDRWEALLLLDVIRNIAKIHLDARGRDHELVVMLVLDCLAAKTPVVVTTDFDGVGKEVVTLDDQVFNDSIDHGVGDLDTRNGDISSVLEDARYDNLGKILDEMRLELGLTVLIVAQVEEELLGCSSERLVLGILVELVSHELGLVDDAVGVVSVTFAEEELTLVIDAVPLVIGRILQNETLLLKTATDEFVEILEPVLQFGVLVGITIDIIQCIEQVIEARRVRETFDQSLQLCQRCFVGRKSS